MGFASATGFFSAELSGCAIETSLAAAASAFIGRKFQQARMFYSARDWAGFAADLIQIQKTRPFRGRSADGLFGVRGLQHRTGAPQLAARRLPRAPPALSPSLHSGRRPAYGVALLILRQSMSTDVKVLVAGADMTAQGGLLHRLGREPVAVHGSHVDEPGVVRRGVR